MKHALLLFTLIAFQACDFSKRIDTAAAVKEMKARQVKRVLPQDIVNQVDTWGQEIQAKGAKVILVTPAVIGERYDQSNPQDGELNLYSNWIRKYAAEKKIALVDCRKLFLDYSAKNNPKNVDKGILTYDRVHLNDAGNQLVADAVWEAIK